MHIRIDKPCRNCHKIPEKGYWPSRARRYDWICPKCCRAGQNSRRKTKMPQGVKEEVPNA